MPGVTNSRPKLLPLFRTERLSALVVDNDRASHMVQEAYLSRHRFHTRVVTNGREAVNLIASGAKFHLIIMDKQVPIIDGVEATRLIRALGVISKIIGYYGVWDERVKNEFIAAGADEFVVKPLRDEAALNRIVRELD